MPNPLRSHVNFVHILLGLAKEFGWPPTASPAELAWQSALWNHLTAQHPNGWASLTRSACAGDKTPEALDDADLDAFVRFKAIPTETKFARKIARAFSTFVAEAGLTGQFCRLSPPRRDYFFGITVDQIPELLRNEVRALVDYEVRSPSWRLPAQHATRTRTCAGAQRSSPLAPSHLRARSRGSSGSRLRR